MLAGLEKAELVIAQDAFLETETNEYADVLLPAALWTESDGVMVNSERNLTPVPAGGRSAPGRHCRTGRSSPGSLARWGFRDSFSYASAEEVFEEIKRFWNPKTGYDLRGVSYERLRQTPLQWPCPPDGADDRNPIRYLNDGVSQHRLVREDGSVPRLAFPTPHGRAVFFARPHLPPEEMPDDDYPFLLNTGRLPHQWHTMTKTGKVAKLNKLNPGPFVEIHPEDAARLEIGDGDRVEIASRRGRAVLPAVITDRVRPGDCFAPFHWNDVFGEYLSINAVTNDAVDPISRQPEFKACAVTLTKVAVAHRCRPIRAGHAAIPPGGRKPAWRKSTPSPNSSAWQPNRRRSSMRSAAPIWRDCWPALRVEAGRRDAGVPTLPVSAPFDAAAPGCGWTALLAGHVLPHRRRNPTPAPSRHRRCQPAGRRRARTDRGVVGVADR